MKAEINASGLYEVQVDDVTYEFEKWGAEESFDVLLDLVKVCGEPLAAAVGALFGKADPDEKIDPQIMTTVFRSLTCGLGDKSLVKALTKRLVAEKVLCQGTKIVFNLHYKDRLDHMFKVLWAALEVQYGNFIAAVLAMLRVRPAFLSNQPAT